MTKSRFTRLGLVSLLLMIAVVGSSCSYYNKVMARMNLVDGAQAYNERKFDEAMEKFTKAVEYDPEGNTLESRTAQLFLARTLHSLFAGNRREKGNAERAIEEYKKALPGFVRQVAEDKAALDASPEDEKLQGNYEKNQKIVGSIISAVGSLYDNLQQEDKWFEWQNTAADNGELPGSVRANSLTALAAKKYTCANDITDKKEIKKTVTKGGEQAFEFSKPESEEEFETLKKCVSDGTGFIDRAIELNSESDSAWSYRASLYVQSMRVAEMEGNSEKQAEFKKKSEDAKAKFEELAKARREREEKEAAEKAKELGGESAEEGDSDEKKSEESSDEKKEVESDQ